MALPGSWAEIEARLGAVLGSAPGGREWLRQALLAGFGAGDPALLVRVRRQVAFQRACGALLRLEEHDGDLAFALDQREVVAAAFARHFDGAVLEGPPWRLGPSESGRLSEREWAALADFEAAA